MTATIVTGTAQVREEEARNSDLPNYSGLSPSRDACSSDHPN